MVPASAVCAALAVSALFPKERSRRWQLAALVPVLAWAIQHLVALPPFAVPLAVGLVVCARAPRLAPAVFLLALPAYPDLASALVAAAVWLVGGALVDGWRRRLDDESNPRRSAVLRVLVVGCIYYALGPLFYL